MKLLRNDVLVEEIIGKPSSVWRSMVAYCLIVIQVKFMYTKFSFNVVKSSGYEVVLNLDCSRLPYMISKHSFWPSVAQRDRIQSMHLVFTLCILLPRRTFFWIRKKKWWRNNIEVGTIEQEMLSDVEDYHMVISGFSFCLDIL
jgi:hypothetical protein